MNPGLPHTRADSCKSDGEASADGRERRDPHGTALLLGLGLRVRFRGAPFSD